MELLTKEWYLTTQLYSLRDFAEVSKHATVTDDSAIRDLYVQTENDFLDTARTKAKPAEVSELFVREQFHARYEYLLELCELLPPEIRAAIPDIRLFCLGYTTKRAKRKLDKYLSTLYIALSEPKIKRIGKAMRAERLL